MSTPLPNYVRSQRKRAGLSQDELAFLLGWKTGSHVCRHERFCRTPTARTAFACEVIFNVPARDLFRGFCAGVERGVAMRSRKLIERLGTEKKHASKVEFLQSLCKVHEP